MAKYKVGDRVISKLDTRDYGVIIEIPSKDAPLTYKVRIDSNDGVYDALYDECDLDFDAQSGTVLYEHKDTTNHLADTRKMVDWEQRRYEIAKEVLPTIYRRFAGDSYNNKYAKYAVELADALIEELKEGGGHDNDN